MELGIKKIFPGLNEKMGSGNDSSSERYEIVSIDEENSDKKNLYVKIRAKRVRGVFLKPISVLYTKEWLECFSREDAAYIAVLYLSEKEGNPDLIKKFPRKKQVITKNVVILAMFFITFLIISNLTGFKIVELNSSNFPFLVGFFKHFDFNFPAALIFFPLTYFFDDTLTEVYGFKVSRLVIWSGLLCNTIFTICTFATVYLPPSHFWHYQSEFSLIFTSAPRIFIASTIGYFCGEFLNSMAMSKIKIMTSGRWLWARIISSTAVGVFFDSVLFCHIAFYNKVSSAIIWEMVMVQCIFKVSYEILALPLTYKIVSFLKKNDEVDYYDFSTDYNPFSLKIDDESVK